MKKLVSLLVIAALALTCSAVIYDSGKNNRAGRVVAGVVTDVPENATVVNYSEVDASGTDLESVLDSAIQNGTVIRRKSAEEMSRLRDRLTDVPRLDDPDAYGYYLRYEGHVIQVRLLYNR